MTCVQHLVELAHDIVDEAPALATVMQRQTGTALVLTEEGWGLQFGVAIEKETKRHVKY